MRQRDYTREIIFQLRGRSGPTRLRDICVALGILEPKHLKRNGGTWPAAVAAKYNAVGKHLQAMQAAGTVKLTKGPKGGWSVP